MIALIIILGVSGIICFMWIIDSFKCDFFAGMLNLVIGLVLISLSYIGLGSMIERTTYQKALIDNPYKMEIRYELKDSVYIPIDTLYIYK